MILSHVRKTIDGFGLDIGFSDHFNSQLVIILNFSAIADFHTLLITTAQAVFFDPQCLHY
jgi:hypothetical protein